MPRVMVVDDEAIICTQLEERLGSMGYEVVGTAFSGEEAIEMAGQRKPEVVLMDIVMPGKLDGIDASAIIREEMDIPVVFLTGYTDAKYVERAKMVEPFGYIVKPYQEREISATLEVTLYKKAMERQLHDLERKAQVVNRLASIGEMASGIAHEINNPLNQRGRLLRAADDKGPTRRLTGRRWDYPRRLPEGSRYRE